MFRRVNTLDRMNYINSELTGTVFRLVYLKNTLAFNTTSYILKYIEKMIFSTKADTIILNISAVDHIDSSAVGMFITIKHAMNKINKTFILEGLTDNVRRVLQILDINNYLTAA